MIAVDTSAILAILLQEDDAQRFADAMDAAEVPLLSSANLVEASIVLANRLPPSADRLLDDLIASAGMVIEPVTVTQAQLARQAHRDYGRGRHPAALNFGDCFAYALAKSMDLPLLFKGNDFAQTDIAPC